MWCLLFLDATEPISKVDKQLADYILDQHKPAIFVVNKWDLLTPMPTGKMADYIKATFPSLDHVPIAFITAKVGKNVQAVLNLAQTLYKQASARVGTGDLNRVLRQALEVNPPPMRQNRRPKIFYATQPATNPPTIVLFTNGPELLDNTYLRFLLRTFREQLPFQEVSIRLALRSKVRSEPGSNDADEASEELQTPLEPSRPRKLAKDRATLPPDDDAAEQKPKDRKQSARKPAVKKPGKAKKDRGPELWKGM